MEEALGTLSACIPSGPNWSYVLAQLYEGSNHTPLPKDKHLGVLPQGKVESPCGQISQLKVCQLLSTGPWVIYLVGLNGSDQPVTINLPELLHSGSSVTTDEHPYMRIDIPLPNPEVPECTTPPLGGAKATPAATVPKTPWKPRITLMAEVNDLLNRGMADDYNSKPEHSAMGKEAATEADMPLPHKAEVPAPPVDTSSQASVEEVVATLKSNPINVSPTMAACSSHSDSPMVGLTELQEDANLAANYMLSVKRSSDLKRQQAIWEFKVSLCQQEAEEAAANEKAKIIHSRKNLNAKVGCAKAVMEAKYNYRVAIQEARTIRSNQLQESETAYSKALGKNAAMRSTQSARLHREHVKLMHELEEQAIREESKSCHNFFFCLSSHPTPCSAAPQGESVYLLPHFDRVITFITSICSIFQDTPGRGTAICNCYSQARTQVVPNGQKGNILCQIYGEAHPWMKLPLRPHRKDHQAPKEERLPTGLPP